MSSSTDRSRRHRERVRDGKIVLGEIALDELALVDLLLARGFLRVRTEDKETITRAFERHVAELLAESGTT
jgi:hypothetical protein